MTNPQLIILLRFFQFVAEISFLLKPISRFYEFTGKNPNIHTDICIYIYIDRERQTDRQIPRYIINKKQRG